MNKGVTLIELLIAIAIITLMSAAAIPIYGNLQVSSQINENSTLIIQTIRTARQNSISRVNNLGHGVRFFSNSFVMYQGTDYGTRQAQYDREIPLDSSLAITTNLTNDEVNFSRSTGVPSEAGEVTLSHDLGDVKTIIINKFGAIEED